MDNSSSSKEYAAQLQVDQIVAGTTTLADYVESIGRSLLSTDGNTQDEALQRLTSVVQLLPPTFLSQEQTDLLLSFFLCRFGSFRNGTAILDAIKHLIMSGPEISAASTHAIFNVLYEEGSAKGLPVQCRLSYYTLLKLILENSNCREVIIQCGSLSVVSTFIRAVEGEAEPRCLSVVLQLHQYVATTFEMGPLVDDMFDAAACYFPIDFIEIPGKVTVTMETLSLCLRDCLTSTYKFAPFLFLMVQEKMADSRTAFEEKLAICELIGHAFLKFPFHTLSTQLKAVTAIVRSVGLDPTIIGVIPKQASSCLEAILICCSKAKPKYLNEVVEDMLDSNEPFVLQAEMGLSSKALQLLWVIAVKLPDMAGLVYDRIIPWIISLVQGSTVSAAANRKEIMAEGLQYLSFFIKKGCELLPDSVVQKAMTKFEETIITSCDEQIRTAEVEQRIVLYGILSDCISIKVLSAAAIERVEVELRNTVNNCIDIEGKSQTAVFALAQAFAKAYPENFFNLISEYFVGTPQDFSSLSDKIVWLMAAGLDPKCRIWDLYPKFLELLRQNLSTSKLDAVLLCVKRLQSLGYNSSMVIDVLLLLADVSTEQNSSLATSDVASYSQLFGLLLNDEDHINICRQLIINPNSCMTGLLCQNVSAEGIRYVTKALSLPQYATEHELLVFTLINRNGKDADVSKFSHEIWFPFVLSTALLIRPDCGFEVKEELFKAFAAVEMSPQPYSAANLLCRWNSHRYDPELNRWYCTPLWAQKFLHFVTDSYIEYFNLTISESQCKLMAILPPLLSFAEFVGECRHHDIKKLLPIIEAALSSHSLPLLINSLPSLLEVTSVEEMTDSFCADICQELTCYVMDPDVDTENLLIAVETLDLLVKKAPKMHICRHSSTIIAALDRLLSHKRKTLRLATSSVIEKWYSILF